MSGLKFAVEYTIWTEEQWDGVHFSNVSQRLTCSVELGAFNLEEEV